MELKQKIHDALLIELVKKDNNGKFPNLLKLVRDRNFSVKCSVDLNGKGCVDVVLTYPKHVVSREMGDYGLYMGTEGANDVALELITDRDFDSGQKLEQG